MGTLRSRRIDTHRSNIHDCRRLMYIYVPEALPPFQKRILPSSLKQETIPTDSHNGYSRRFAVRYGNRLIQSECHLHRLDRQHGIGRTSGSRYILYDRFSALFGNRCCRNHLDKQCTRKQQRSRDTSHCNSRDTYRTRSHTGRYRYHVFCPPTHRIYFYRLARRRYARIGDCHTDDCLSTGRWPANHSCRSITRTRSSKTDGMDRFHQLFYSQPSRLLLFCIPMSGRCTGSLVGLSRGTQLRSPAFLLAIPSEQQT